MKTKTTAWELRKLLQEFGEGKDAQVQELLELGVKWSKHAAMKAGNSTNSAMMCQLLPVTLPSKQLRKRLKERLDETLGKRAPNAPPPGTPPNFAQVSAEQAARAAITAMMPTASTPKQLSDFYLKGIEDSMRLNHANESEPSYKRFSKVKKAAVMGWCKARTWKQVPEIWKEIEATTCESDLRRVLDRHWSKHQGSLNHQYYNIWWPDEFVKAIRMVEPVESGQACFLTSCLGMSLLNLLPRSAAEIAIIKKDKRARDKAMSNLTFAEAKQIEKAPRLPPTTYEGTLMLLTTWALFLAMLFTEHNEHLQGVDEVRARLMEMSGVTEKLTPMYLANVMWAVLDDQCKHFNECMSMDDFRNPRGRVIWPRTNLRGFAQTMAGQQNILLLTFPDEWKAVISDEPLELDVDTYGRSSSGGGGGGRATPANRDRNAGGRGGRGASGGKAWIAAHSDRYGKASNPQVPRVLKELVAPIRDDKGRLFVSDLYKQANTSYAELVKGDGMQSDRHPCPTYTLGFCGNPNCYNLHQFSSELPPGYAQYLCTELKPGVEALKKESASSKGGGRGNGRGRKRDREDGDGAEADASG